MITTRLLHSYHGRPYTAVITPALKSRGKVQTSTYVIYRFLTNTTPNDHVVAVIPLSESTSSDVFDTMISAWVKLRLHSQGRVRLD